MPLYYIETSALLKRYRTERGTDVIDELFDHKMADDVFVTSYLTAVEVEAAAARALRGRLLNQTGYRTLLGSFAEDSGELIVPQPVSSTIVSDAAQPARRYALRAADAVHLATAVVARRAAGTETVYVADERELRAAAEGERFALLNPEQDGAVDTLRGYRAVGS